MGIPLRVLIVEDSEDDATLVLHELHRNGYDPVFERVDNYKAMGDALARKEWDVVIADYSMPKFDGIKALKLLEKKQLDLPFILVSGAIGEDVAVEAMKAGVDDYVMKDNLLRLVPAIQRELVEYKERRRTRKVDDQYRKLYRAIEHSPSVVIITDKEGTIEYVNPKFFDLSGYSTEEVVGKNPSIWNAGKQSHKFYDELWDTIKSGKEWRGEFCNKKKNGELYWESASISAVKNEKGVITNYVAVKEDITERRQIEDAIQALVKSTVGITGLEFFDRITDIICEWLDTEYAFIGNIENGKTAKALSMNVDGEKVSDYIYDLSGTPCENVVKNSFCIHPEGVSKLFPHDKDLIAMKIEGYVGVSLKDKNGKLIGILWTASRHKINQPLRMTEVLDIIAAKASAEIERMHTEEKIKASLREKEVLLKEIHHRVKNNMQIVSSLLNLQSEFIDDENIRQILGESQNRVKSMALVHEKLYQTKDLSSIDFGEYTRSLTASLLHSFGDNANSVRIKIDMDEVYLDINKAIPCGLIINEIVSNSIKHAFPASTTGIDKNKFQGKGVIKISMRKNADPESSTNADVDTGIIELVVGDNGIGLPEGLDFRNTKTLGMELVNTLTGQLGGSIEYVNNGGTEFKITFGV